MDATTFALQTLNGLQYGLVLFLVASGLTLVFGILGIINLAHGVFYMLGAYLAAFFAVQTGSFLLAVVGATLVTFVVGLVLERTLFRALYRRDHLDQLLLTFGLILVVDELRQMAFGKEVHSVALPVFLQGLIRVDEVLTYPVYRLVVGVVCLLVAAGIFFVIQRTRIGMIVRAGAENRDMTRALGIGFDRVNALVFASGVGLAALGGAVMAPLSTVYPGMDSQMLILSFVVVVLGGIGSVSGAALGALLIGLADTYAKMFLPGLSSFTVYALMAGVLLWRPQGLMGRA
jgi:branched-chain amino acid transport system permease protein